MSAEEGSRLAAAIRWAGIDLVTLDYLGPGLLDHHLAELGRNFEAEGFARECPAIMEVLGIDLEYLQKGLPNFREVEYLHPLIQLAPHMTAEQVEDQLRLYINRRARKARLKP